MPADLAIPDVYKGDKVLIFYSSGNNHVCVEMGDAPFSLADFEAFAASDEATKVGFNGTYMNHISGINEALYDKAREFLLGLEADPTISRIELSDLLRTLPSSSEGF